MNMYVKQIDFHLYSFQMAYLNSAPVHHKKNSQKSAFAHRLKAIH